MSGLRRLITAFYHCRRPSTRAMTGGQDMRAHLSFLQRSEGGLPLAERDHDGTVDFSPRWWLAGSRVAERRLKGHAALGHQPSLRDGSTLGSPIRGLKSPRLRSSSRSATASHSSGAPRARVPETPERATFLNTRARTRTRRRRKISPARAPAFSKRICLRA